MTEYHEPTTASAEELAALLQAELNELDVLDIIGGGVSDNACCCVGPQNGAPLCPCQMLSVRVVDGRYVQVTDLGPAPDEHRCGVRGFDGMKGDVCPACSEFTSDDLQQWKRACRRPNHYAK